LFKSTIKLENCLLQKECKRGPERTISGSKFSNIAAILTVNILENRNIESIVFQNRNKASGFFTGPQTSSSVNIILTGPKSEVNIILTGPYITY
jgi:hypothetical protein